MCDKADKIKEWLKQVPEKNIIVAFSGGVDSSVVLRLAADVSECTEKGVYAFFFRTMLHPMRDEAEAETAAKKMNVQFETLVFDELEFEEIKDNPPDRCYRCKKHLFLRLKERTKEIGNALILEGSNTDDLKEYRPGLRAIRELDVKSPLAMFGLTKKEIRTLAEEMGLPTAEKPSSPCLATRFPYGTRLHMAEMKKVEEGEAFLRDKGYGNIRLRVEGNTARIEVDTENLKRLIEEREEVIKKMKHLGYDYVTLDLEGFRSGSMDIKNAAGGI